MRYLPIFFLPFSCIGISSVFTAISIVIYLFCMKKKIIYNNIIFFRNNKAIIISCSIMIIWIFSMIIASVINGEYRGILESKHYAERMLYFILAILFFTRDKKYFISFLFGLSGAVSILDINTIFNFLYYSQWRPETLLGNPNKLGGYLILVLPFIGIGLVILREKMLYRLLELFVFLITGIALFLSGSRGAWIGIISSLFILLVIIMFMEKDVIKTKKILNYIVYVFVCCVAVAVLFYIINPKFIFHSSDMERLYLWNSAIHMIKDNPIAGIGFGNFNEVYNNGYISEYAQEPKLTSPHNIFLHYTVSFGLLGGLTFIFLIFSQIYILLNNVRNINESKKLVVYASLCGIIGMIIHGMVDTLITTKPYASMYWLLYGVSICCFFNNTVESMSYNRNKL